MAVTRSRVGSPRDWIIVGITFLCLSGLIGFASYVSFPPSKPLVATGTVISVSSRSPSRSPKLNILIETGQGVLHLYTDLGKVSSKVVVGDMVRAEYDTDVFGRNFHRIWDLRRGEEILFSKERAFPAATAEAEQVGWLAFFCSLFSVAVIGAGAWLYASSRPNP